MYPEAEQPARCAKTSAWRALLIVLAATLALLPALARAYPDRPIRLLVNFPPGASTDVIARILAKPLADSLGQPVVVENRPGAGGTIGAEAVAKAAPDGYTIGVFAGSHSTSASLYRKLRYAPIDDFAPISQAVSLPFFLLVGPTVKAKNVGEFLATAKKDSVLYGSGGNGNTMHLAGELLNRMAGTRMAHVPYKGGAPAFVDLMGGQISLLIAPSDLATKSLQVGNVRALAVASKSRSALFPDVPTMGEYGLPEYEVTSWVGFLAPRGTPEAIVDRLSRTVREAIASAEVREQITKLGAEPIGSAPREFAAFLRADIERWSRVVREAGIEPLD